MSENRSTIVPAQCFAKTCESGPLCNSLLVEPTRSARGEDCERWRFVAVGERMVPPGDLQDAGCDCFWGAVVRKFAVHSEIETDRRGRFAELDPRVAPAGLADPAKAL